MAFTIPDNYGAAIIPIGFSFFVNFWLSGQVMSARTKYGVEYPNMYAIAGAAKTLKGENAGVISQEDANAFNQVQRAHQNFLEQVPFAIPFIGIVGLYNPILAGVAGTIYLIGRIIYALGYYKAPSKRVPGAIISLLSVVTLAVSVIYYGAKTAF